MKKLGQAAQTPPPDPGFSSQQLPPQSSLSTVCWGRQEPCRLMSYKIFVLEGQFCLRNLCIRYHYVIHLMNTYTFKFRISMWTVLTTIANATYSKGKQKTVFKVFIWIWKYSTRVSKNNGQSALCPGNACQSSSIKKITYPKPMTIAHHSSLSRRESIIKMQTSDPHCTVMCTGTVRSILEIGHSVRVLETVQVKQW